MGGDALVSALAGYDTLAASDTWQFLERQIVSPLTTVSDRDPYHHTSKMAFRLFPPYLGKLCWGCSLRSIMLFLIGLEYLAGFLFFFFVYKLLAPFCQNKVSLTWLTFGICFTFLGKIFFWDTYAYFDAFALLFLLLSLYAKNPILIFVYLLLAFWTDERAVVASALVFVWWSMAEDTSEKAIIIFRPFSFKLAPQQLAIILAMVVTVVLRWLLVAYSNRPSLTDLAQVMTEARFVLIKQRLVELIPFVTVSSFESYWIFVVCATLFLWLNRERLALSIYLLATLASLGVSFLVYDMTRSIMYAFPAVIIGIRITAKVLPPPAFQRLAFWVLVVAAIYPTYYLSHYMWPFFIRILRF